MKLRIQMEESKEIFQEGKLLSGKMKLKGDQLGLLWFLKNEKLAFSSDFDNDFIIWTGHIWGFTLYPFNLYVNVQRTQLTMHLRIFFTYNVGFLILYIYYSMD